MLLLFLSFKLLLLLLLLLYFCWYFWFESVHLAPSRVLVLPLAVKPVQNTVIGNTPTQVVEMIYFLLKFMGDFEKMSGIGRSAGEEVFFSDNATALLKMVRYAVKFIKSFEKILN